MTYKKSRARIEFDGQIGLALAEMQPIYLISKRLPSGGSRLLAVYYIFLFAQFENYVKRIVEDCIDCVSSSGAGIGDLPDSLVAYLIHRGENVAENYRKFSYVEDEGAVLTALAASLRKISAWSQGGSGPLLEASHFLEKKKYPSPKNLPQLFKRLGIANIWSVINPIGRMNGLLVLTSLNDLRTSITHEGRIPAGFSRRDFSDRVGQMRKFVAALDRGVAAHFTKDVVSRSDWNARVC